jgi:outer membrane lipoprotein-sorting protein
LRRTRVTLLTITILSLSLCAVAHTEPRSVAEVVKKVKAVYSRDCCFKATFNQVTVNVAMDLKDRFDGTIYVKKPGLIALDVESPERQKVVLRGRSYVIYFPEDRSAARGEVPPEMDVEHFFGFFANIGDMERNFSIQFPNRMVDEVEKLIFLELTARNNPRSTFRIMLGIDLNRFTIRRAIIYDALGNYNRFDLSNITFLSSVPDKVFEDVPAASEKADLSLIPAIKNSGR